MIKRIALILLLCGVMLCTVACTVTEETSNTAPTVVVPSFVGLSYSFVIDDPEITAQFQFETVEEESDTPSGTILSQNPRPGDTAVQGDTVTLTIAK